MVKLSQLMAAAESASPERLEKALAILSDSTPPPVRTEVAMRELGVSRRSIYRHGVPVRRMAGQNFYDLEQLREAMSR